MSTQPSLLKKSLGLQVLLLIFGITFSMVAISSAISLYLGGKSMFAQMQANSQEVYQLLRLSIEKPMVIGNDKGTTAEFNNLAVKFPATNISIASFTGSVTYSTKPNQIRSSIADAFPADIATIYQKALKGEHIPGTQLKLDGREKFLNITPILNEKSCYHCHGSSQPVLGAMAVIQDVEDNIQAFNQITLTSTSISIAGGILLALLIYLFIKAKVIKRLQSLEATSAEITKGNFNAHFAISGVDELGNLATNLSNMLHELKLLGVAQSIIKSMSIPIIMSTAKGEINLINQQLLDLLGYKITPTEALGQPYSKFFGIHAEIDAMVNKIISGKSTGETLETSLLNNTGKELRLQLDCVPVLSLEGELLGIFSTISDLTDIRENEQAILRQNTTIHSTIREARVLSEELTEAAQSLGQQVEVTKNRAHSQQDITDKTAIAIGDMNTVLEDVARNAARAASHASDTRDSALQGVQQTSVIAKSMQSIVISANNLKVHMQELGEKTSDIENILQTIQDIADQTNLLALNAAIEAARAGDAGRGFAVVADEVRKLAEKTMEATKKVDTTITEIRISTDANIQAVEVTADTVTKEAQLINETEHVLQSILSLAESVSDQINAIATAAEQQFASSACISDSTNDIKTLSMETMASSVTSEYAVKSLTEISINLNKVIESMASHEE